MSSLRLAMKLSQNEYNNPKKAVNGQTRSAGKVDEPKAKSPVNLVYKNHISHRAMTEPLESADSDISSDDENDDDDDYRTNNDKDIVEASVIPQNTKPSQNIEKPVIENGNQRQNGNTKETSKTLIENVDIHSDTLKSDIIKPVPSDKDVLIFENDEFQFNMTILQSDHVRNEKLRKDAELAITELQQLKRQRRLQFNLNMSSTER